MENMSNWDGGSDMGEANSTKNVEVANRAFQMLICARIFVLKELIKKLPKGTDPMVARRRWVLVQALPPSLSPEGEIFNVVITSLRAADTMIMRTLICSMLSEIKNIAGKTIFPNKPLFTVVDEVQVAAQYLEISFRSSTTGTDMRPVLHAFHRFLWDTDLVRGVILSGTGLSMNTVRTAVSSKSALASHPIPFVFTEVGHRKGRSSP